MFPAPLRGRGRGKIPNVTKVYRIIELCQAAAVIHSILEVRAAEIWKNVKQKKSPRRKPLGRFLAGRLFEAIF